MSHPTADDVVAAALNLAPQIRAARDELEATRQLPPSLVHTLAAAGLLQLHLPRSMGGWELPPLTAFRAIEALSKCDGSVGWCAMIATAFSLSAGWLRAEVGRTLCGQPPDLRVAGSIRPQGQAYPVRGRLPYPGALELCQRHPPCPLARLPLYRDGGRAATGDP
jgi:indole-3-acetate monooxygenase